MAERDGIDDAIDGVYALSRLAIMKLLPSNDPEIQRKSLLGWNVLCCPHAVRGNSRSWTSPVRACRRLRYQCD